jgi:hypothetical protein
VTDLQRAEALAIGLVTQALTEDEATTDDFERFVVPAVAEIVRGPERDDVVLKLVQLLQTAAVYGAMRSGDFDDPSVQASEIKASAAQWWQDFLGFWEGRNS